ncbi:contact-dependent growth inhibition system immunity protein [Kitasatospora sp. NPDC085879]|uniref:contact-dependent growth inhibition system immunity protein n=1 Tax=Kitasatospora sp. NPDC085879 TaxID=3154769 RepID=UPI003441C354
MTAEPAAADRCLDELEGAWPDPAPGATRLVTTAHALRRVPLRDLGAGGLRLLIGQGVGLPHLVPLALDLLERDPAAEGGLFPGDLLDAVARRGPELRSDHPELAERLVAVVAAATDQVGRAERAERAGQVRR